LAGYLIVLAGEFAITRPWTLRAPGKAGGKSNNASPLFGRDAPSEHRVMGL